MDPATQQFPSAQLQLIQNLTATIQNIQAQQKSITTSSTTSTVGQA
jgi:hypothetical protein